MEALILDGQPLSLAQIEAVAITACPVKIADSAVSRVKQSRACIEEILAAGETVYGVNTGFGKLSDVRIAQDKLCLLYTSRRGTHAEAALGKVEAIANKTSHSIKRSPMEQGSIDTPLEDAILDEAAYRVVRDVYKRQVIHRLPAY